MEIQKAELEGKICEPSVAFWIARVGEIETALSEIQTEYDRRHTCVLDLSFDLWSSYEISKRAHEKLKLVKELLEEKKKFKSVAKSGVPTRGKEVPVPATIVGLDENLNAALRFLSGSDRTSGILAILGIGGGGKSTLLKAINNELVRSPAFDRVVFIVMSTGTKIEKLKDKSFLILFDDLWDTVDLEALGVPQPIEELAGERRRMIAFTTRSEQVSSDISAPNKEVIKVDRLDDEKAWVLFREHAGRNLMDSNPRIGRLAKEMVRRCDGLPLAIVATAKAMSSKKTYKQWEYVAKQLSQSASPTSEIESSFLPKLEHIAGERRSFPSLKHVYVAMCPALRGVPKGLCNAPNLKSFFVEEEELTAPETTINGSRGGGFCGEENY